jgi:hypothetical protein
MSRARIATTVAVAAAALIAGPIAGPVAAADGNQQTPIVVHIERSGFSFTDAAIGSLVGVGLTLAAIGCMAVMRSRDVGEASARKARKA